MPGVEGMELRVEVAGDAIVAATVVLQDSAVQLQAFAAPKNEGIWGEVREEIASGITQQGGVIDEVEGPLGWELRAQVPVQLPDGTDGVQVVRFVGVDGPRWFLRGVISGQGAVQPEAAGLLEQIFRDTVVVRGDAPMAPRDPIVLKLPDDAQMVPDGVQQEPVEEGSRFAGGLDQLAARTGDHRGPLTQLRRRGSSVGRTPSAGGSADGFVHGPRAPPMRSAGPSRRTQVRCAQGRMRPVNGALMAVREASTAAACGGNRGLLWSPSNPRISPRSTRWPTWPSSSPRSRSSRWWLSSPRG